jgi:hypothetical protein
MTPILVFFRVPKFSIRCKDDTVFEPTGRSRQTSGCRPPALVEAGSAEYRASLSRDEWNTSGPFARRANDRSFLGSFSTQVPAVLAGLRIMYVLLLRKELLFARAECKFVSAYAADQFPLFELHIFVLPAMGNVERKQSHDRCLLRSVCCIAALRFG